VCSTDWSTSPGLRAASAAPPWRARARHAKAQHVENLREELALLRALLAADPLVAASVTEFDVYLARLLGRPDATVTVEGG
jgi:hypothetical protein